MIMLKWLLSKIAGSVASEAASAAAGGVMAWLQQYLVYILAGVIAVLVIACGVQTVRVWGLKKDVATVNAQLQQKESLIQGYVVKTKEAQDRVDAASRKAAESEAKHKDEVAKLRAEKPAVITRYLPTNQVICQKDGSGTYGPVAQQTTPIIVNCQEIFDSAVERLPKILGGGYQ